MTDAPKQPEASRAKSQNTQPDYDPVPEIAAELKLAPQSVAAVTRLLSEGATVPFIARYRKEATQGLDEVAIRAIEERRDYLSDLHARKQTVLAEIARQGKLTPELERQIRATGSKTELEDLYLPYKPKRRTRAMIARERGLEPLAELIWGQARSGNPDSAAQAYVDAEKGVPDIAAALAGARDICAERLSEQAHVRGALREALLRDAVISVQKAKDHAKQATKFDAYENFSEKLATVPSHRFLAIRRGESEGVLKVELELDTAPITRLMESSAKLDRASPFAPQLQSAIDDALTRLLLPSANVEARVEVKQRSDRDAIQIFAQNLRELLLSAPLGPKSVLGIDPGQRTGCKCAVVDATGKLLDHANIYLVQGDEALARARETLQRLCKTHKPMAIAVGNGTHGREAESFARAVLDELGLTREGVFCVSVSESGASVYSASEIAREEFPDLDLTVRGAISIARRLQDPLAELVKVDPKSIGVGQYQHDVSQPLLQRKLDEVVESCVNQVGVELNTASASLLSRVAGIGPSLAKKIVAHRDRNGSFVRRKQLLEVSSLGPRAFEQAAGFLRIYGAADPLDASAVHPERYPLVEQMARDLGVKVAQLVERPELVDKIDPQRYASNDVGQYTLRDILSELRKPGRDPRSSFEPPRFREDVRTLEDLKQGMELEGVVTNVTAFGAFVDVGVHQDGLVHVSQLADRFVKNPAEVVKVGDKLKVRVLEVDLQRRRIGLSARKQPVEGAQQNRAPRDQAGPRDQGAQQPRGPRDQGGPNRGPRDQGGPRGGDGRGSAPAGTRQEQPAKGAHQSKNSDEPLRHNPFADRFRR
jgi:protein Tex